MSDRILSFTSSLIEKSRDFRYFGLICSLALILDSALAYSLGSSLYEFRLSDFGKNIGTGNLILFLVLFSFYLSFVVPLIKHSIFWSSQLIPYKVSSFLWPPEEHDTDTRKNYLRSNELKAYAIKKDNNVAYNVYLEEFKNNEEQDSLCYFSLSLLVSSCINISLSYDVEHTIIKSVLSLASSEVGFSSIVVSAILTLLFMFCFYLGVIIYCGLSPKDRDRIYMYRHGLDIDS